MATPSSPARSARTTAPPGRTIPDVTDQPDRLAALVTLLRQVEAAHGVYENDVLHGVYDQEWPRWYAEYAVANGIGIVLGRAVTTEELAGFLASSWDQIRQLDPKPTDPWAALMARRIAAEL